MKHNQLFRTMSTLALCTVALLASACAGSNRGVDVGNPLDLDEGTPNVYRNADRGIAITPPDGYDFEVLDEATVAFRPIAVQDSRVITAEFFDAEPIDSYLATYYDGCTTEAVVGFAGFDAVAVTGCDLSGKLLILASASTLLEMHATATASGDLMRFAVTTDEPIEEGEGIEHTKVTIGEITVAEMATDEEESLWTRSTDIPTPDDLIDEQTVGITDFQFQPISGSPIGERVPRIFGNDDDE